MQLTDLELYRWKFHHDIYIHTTNKYRPSNFILNWTQYWEQYGAFVSVLPRQSGKTEMIITILNSLIKDEDYLIICNTNYSSTMYSKKGFDKNKILEARPNHRQNFRGFMYQNVNLFIDEFERMSRKNYLYHILNHPWKRVTMVSSL